MTLANSTISLPWVIVDLILHASLALGAPVRPSLDVAPDVYTPRVRCAAIQSIPKCHLVAAAAADCTDLVHRWVEYGLPFTSRRKYGGDDGHGELRSVAVRTTTLAKYASRHGQTRFLDALAREEDEAETIYLLQRACVLDSMAAASVAGSLTALEWWRTHIEARAVQRPVELDMPPRAISEIKYFYDLPYSTSDPTCPLSFFQCLCVGPRAARDGAPTAALDWWLTQELRYHHSGLGHAYTLGRVLLSRDNRYRMVVWWFTQFGSNLAAVQLLASFANYQYHLGALATIPLLNLLPHQLGPDNGDNINGWTHGAVMAGMSSTNNVAALTWWRDRHTLTPGAVFAATEWKLPPAESTSNMIQNSTAPELAAFVGGLAALDWWCTAAHIHASHIGRIIESAARGDQTAVLDWAFKHGHDPKPVFAQPTIVRDLLQRRHLKALAWAVSYRIPVKTEYYHAASAVHQDNIDLLDWWVRWTPQVKFYPKAMNVDLISERGSAAMLDWWAKITRDPGYRFEFSYTSRAVDDASAGSHISVLAWWMASGLKLKYTHEAVDIAGARGANRIPVLDWWKNSGLELKYTSAAIDDVCALAGAVPILDWWAASGLPLKYSARALEHAMYESHKSTLAWWAASGLPLRVTRKMNARFRLQMVEGGCSDEAVSAAGLHPMDVHFRVPLLDALEWWQRHVIPAMEQGPSEGSVVEVEPDEAGLPP
ncbi:hypothetical protein BC828DRAFT_403885, partial [Blastocladiella britannica]